MDKKPVIITIIILIIIVGGIIFLTTGNNKATRTNLSQSIAGADLSQAVSQAQQNSNSPSAGSDIQGMKIETLKEGTGAVAKSGDTVTVNYTGTLTDGTKFDSSLNPGRTPFQFTLGQNRVIQGWELGVLGMKVGESRKLTIPPELGYGAQGAGGIIPPNATLIFQVDLLKIN